MLNSIDLEYLERMTPEMTEVLSHILGNKFQAMKTRIKLLDATMRDIAEDEEDPWKEYDYIKRDIEAVLKTSKESIADLTEFLILARMKEN